MLCYLDVGQIFEHRDFPMIPSHSCFVINYNIVVSTCIYDLMMRETPELYLKLSENNSKG